MKIIECYIENFGVISKQRFTFSEGFNVVCSKNGSGKSTLLSFIKAMLYGIGDTRRTSLDENARKRYAPWGGGLFGGSLTLEVGGRLYRVERRFGIRSSEDTVSVFDGRTGMAVVLSDPIGEQLLGIDAEGFERTLYLSERKLSAESDQGSIATKLSDLVGVDGDLGGYEKAMKRLDDQRKELQKKGGSGRIAELKAELFECEMEIAELERASQALAEGESRADAIRAELASLDSAEAKLNEERSAISRNEARESLLAEAKQKRERLVGLNARSAELTELFGGNVPTGTEIAEAAYKKERAEAMLAEGASKPMEVDPAELERVRAILDGKSGNTAEADNDRAARIRRLFSKRVPEREELDECARAVLQGDVKVGKVITLLLLLTVVAVVSTLLGAILHIAEFYLALPICLPIILVVYLATAIRVRRKKKRARAALSSLLEDIGCNVEYSNAATLLSELYSVREEAALNVPSQDERIIEAFLLRNGVTNAVDPYGEARRLIAESERRPDGGKAAEGRRLLDEYNSFISRFGFSGEDRLGQIKAAKDEYDRLFAEIKALSLEITSAEVGSATEAVRTVGEVEASRLLLSGRRSALAEELGAIVSSARGANEKASRLGELRQKKDELTESIAKCEEKLTILKLSAEYLERSRNAMNAKYLGATVAKFKEYSEKISGEEESVGMTADFALHRQDGGATRGIESYSRGMRDLYALAARLALSDSLFTGELPPLLLDDPFTALDDEKCKRALALIRDAARGRQVIYVTCSTSRK